MIDDFGRIVFPEFWTQWINHQFRSAHAAFQPERVTHTGKPPVKPIRTSRKILFPTRCLAAAAISLCRIIPGLSTRRCDFVFFLNKLHSARNSRDTLEKIIKSEHLEWLMFPRDRDRNVVSRVGALMMAKIECPPKPWCTSIVRIDFSNRIVCVTAWYISRRRRVFIFATNLWKLKITLKLLFTHVKSKFLSTKRLFFF